MNDQTRVGLQDEIDDLLERSIATANLLQIAQNHRGDELSNKTIPYAAHYLKEDLHRLREIISDC